MPLILFSREVGHKLYELFSKCKNAPSTKTRLLVEIRASTNIIHDTKMWLQDFQSCPSLIYEGQQLPAIQSLLALFDHEFRYLCKVLENCQELPQDSVFELIVKRLRWAGEADNINQTSVRIGRLTSSMTAALSVTGR